MSSRPSCPAGEPLADQLGDHWSCWPEWTCERPRLLWYLTFEESPVLAERVAQTCSTLATASVDVVPPRWLHLTLCDVGFVDEVEAARVDRAAASVAEVLGDHPPVPLTLGPLATMTDAVVLEAGPPEVLRRLRHRVKRATARAGLTVQHAVDEPFRPHVSLCYLTGSTDGPRVRAAVRSAPPPRSEVLTDRVTLAAVTRSDGHYHWSARARVPLGGQVGGQVGGHVGSALSG